MSDDMDDDDGGDEVAGIPEWVVTFGDMMSLLLTFFIMLVSLSEIKQDEKFQALVESIKQSFGHTTSQSSMIPGRSKPRNSNMQSVANMARAKKKDTHSGGDKVEAPVGDNKTVRIIREGTRTAIGTVVTFDASEIALGDDQKQALADLAQKFRGKPQKIEVRGHTSRRPLPPNSPFKDHNDLAYNRCRVVRDYLVFELNIEPQRIRMSVAGAYEPIHNSVDVDLMKMNPRVEVFTLDEVTDDYNGTSSENADRVISDDSFN
jgi:chemotaxis protein MotB